MKALIALTYAISLSALAVALAKHNAPAEPCVQPGDIRWHGGKACIVERVTIDEKTKFMIIDESLLDLL